jgi:hypothetical protein
MSFVASETFLLKLGMSHCSRKYPFNSSALADFSRLGNGNSVLKDDI